MTARPDPRPRDILWELEERHLHEAEFALELWEDAHDSPDYTLDELTSGPERRLFNHVAALVAGGPVVAERLLEPLLGNSVTWSERVCVAVLASADPEPALRALLATEDPDQVLGLVRGLELRADPGLDERALALLAQAPSARAGGVLELLARRRVAVPSWSAVERVGLDDPSSARAMASLARHSPDPLALGILTALARHQDADVRAAVLDTALVRGVTGAWESVVYWAFQAADASSRRHALARAASLGDAATRARVLDQLDDDATRADALWAAGFTGSVAAVERALSWLEDDELGPLAAEVVCAIAGLPIEEPRSWRDAPAEAHDGGLPPLRLDDLDADLALRPEELLPQPNAETVLAWWGERRHEFAPRLRYLGGHELDAAVMMSALRHAPLRRRHALAFELEARSGGRVQVATRGLGRTQAAQLARLAAELGGMRLDLQGGLGRR